MNDIAITTGAVVELETTTLRGNITIGKGTVVHPTAQILADGGPIHIGANNLIEEGVVIINNSADGNAMTIGDQNVFEVRCRVEAKSIGNSNVIQMRAVVGPEVSLSNGCTIGVSVNLTTSQVVKEKIEVYLKGDSTIKYRQCRDIPQTQDQQLEYLRNLIPNYHKTRKPTRQASAVN